MTRQRYAAAEFEFSQAFVTSPIDGIVASVAVVPGERRQLSTTFRGVTVLDPRLLQCRCLLSPVQAQKLDRLALQHRSAWTAKATAIGVAATGGSGPLSAAAVAAFDRLLEGLTATVENGEQTWPATILHVGIRVDEQTNRVPVLLEVENPEERLRCGIGVEVCFRPR
jgi:multidrug efflux pump subunit AcrA (membrane-fusion protein)